MSDLPPLDSLKVFEAAARAGSFQAAADELSITPSAVSHRIRALEDFLGVTLFDRVGRHVALTGDGARYAGEVGDAIATIRNATRRLTAGKGKRTLNLSLAPAFAMRMLLPRLTRFQRHRCHMVPIEYPGQRHDLLKWDRLRLLAMPLPDDRLLPDFLDVAQLRCIAVLRVKGPADNFVAQNPPKIGRDTLTKIVDPGAGMLVRTRHLQGHGVALRCSTEANPRL